MFEIERRTLRKLSPRSILAPIQRRTSLCEVFHENTKLGRLSARSYGARIAAIGKSTAVKRMMAQAYRTFSLGSSLDLPATPPGNGLEQSIAARRSARAFSGRPLRLDELARLLFYSYGRTAPGGYFRAVASGGGLYPLDLYLFAFRVEQLAPGLYHYDAEHHRLHEVQRGDLLPAFRERVLCQGIEMETAALAVVITATFLRSTFKYQDRGYRMILMEAGEVAQSLALLATALGLGTCLVGGFLDDALSELLHLDGLNEAPLLPMVVGRRQGQEP